MSALNVTSLVLGAIVGLLSLLSQLALWQQKEYRWDRLWSHLKSPQGNLTNYPFNLLATAAILVGWVIYLISFLPLPWALEGYKGEWPTLGVAEGVGFLALLLFFLHHVLRIRKRGVLRPDFTIRALLTLAVAALLIFGTHYNLLTTTFLSPLIWATAIFLAPGFVALAVWPAGLLFQFKKKQIIAAAKRLRAARTQLTIIGITGSYGKTSTKHFLEQILKSAGKKVAATEAHHNTPIGIAQDILLHLTPDLEIYIAELGAYRRGEIKELADIIQPQIGVITAIGNQHLDLFGSQENIRRTKWELVESLPPDGIAILNADSAPIKEADKQEKRFVVWYSLKHKADVWIEHVSLAATQITCTLHLKDFSLGITLPLASEALLSSAIAAAAAALVLEIPTETIARALESLTPFPRTMEIREGKNHATIVDDSHSANEHGTLIAIRHLARFSEPDKRIVFLPFLELGKATAQAHRRVEAAAKEVGAKLHTYKKDPKTFAQQISQGLSEKSVVLLEGRLPDVIRESVLNAAGDDSGGPPSAARKQQRRAPDGGEAVGRTRT